MRKAPLLLEGAVRLAIPVLPAGLKIAAGFAQPLVRRPNGTLRRLWSLFREGLRYFTKIVQRHTVCLGFTFIPDTRLT